MKLSWRDTLAAMLAVLGGVVVFAKLNSYSWWLIGSWKGALGVVAVIGLAILATYFIDWIRDESTGVIGEMILWLAAIAVTAGSLLAVTNRLEFVWSAVLIGLAWVSQLAFHAWDSSRRHDRASRLAQVR